jgi:hypothetical protein
MRFAGIWKWPLESKLWNVPVEGRSFPKHLLHKIVCIGALIASRQTEGWRIDPLGAPHGRVEAMGLAAQIEEVARYCESDMLNTYRVWLIYELFRGTVTLKELEWSEAQIRDFVATRKSTNPHLCGAIGIVQGTNATATGH